MQAFDAYTTNGNQIVINTRGTDEMTRRLTASDVTPEQKAEAKEALQWLAECIERTSNMPQLDQAAWRMVWELELESIAGGMSRIVVTEKNGTTRRTIEPVE